MWKDRWKLLAVLNSTRMEKRLQLKNEIKCKEKKDLHCKKEKSTHTHVYNYTLYTYCMYVKVETHKRVKHILLVKIRDVQSRN